MLHISESYDHLRNQFGIEPGRSYHAADVLIGQLQALGVGLLFEIIVDFLNACHWFDFIPLAAMFEDLRRFSGLFSDASSMLSSYPTETKSEPVGHLTGGLNWENENIYYCVGMSRDACWHEPTHDGGLTS